MILEDGRYIILNDNKQATHKFKDDSDCKTWNEAKDFDNVAIKIPKNCIVLDFDTKSDADIAYSIIKDKKLKCCIMKTQRGIHVWFHSDTPWKSFTKGRLACGIYCDCRSFGRNSYVKIKTHGKMNEWVQEYPLDELDSAPPYFFCPKLKTKESYDFKNLGAGEGRNSKFFAYILLLQSCDIHYTRDDIRETIGIINQYVLPTPLPEDELNKILRDESFKPEREIVRKVEQPPKASINFNAYAHELKETWHTISIDGRVYYYKDGFYHLDTGELAKEIIEAYPDSRIHQRREVLDQVDKISRLASYPEPDPYSINVQNGRLDLRTRTLSEHTPEVIEFGKLPVIFAPDAECPELDHVIEKVFLGRKDIINLFEEMVGYCLMRHAKYGKAFIFLGNGSNGKSTILEVLEHFLGAENYSSLPLEDVAGKFNKAELEHKLANIGDDIDNVVIEDTGTIKKMITGNSLQVEHKGGQPYHIHPYAVHIYSANALPRTADKTEGFYRRWLFVPFEARFSPLDPDYDPLILDKITTDEALSHLLNRALDGARRLIARGRFTEPEAVAQILYRYKRENSTVLTWIEDKEYGKDHFLKLSTTDLYDDYVDWCKMNGFPRSVHSRTFANEIRNRYGFDTKTKQKSNGKRFFQERRIDTDAEPEV